MTAPNEKGSRDTGSDLPSGGSADRPSGTYEGDESVPQHGEPGQPDFETVLQPKSRGMSSLRYRLTRDARQWRTRVRPATRQTPGRLGQPHRPPTLTTSPARTTHRVGRRHRRRKSNPAPGGSETDRDGDMVGPAHTPGTGRGEQKH
jgi:hypothetical protein